MSILLDGQLAATATAIIDGASTPANSPVNVTLTNVGGQTETVVLTVTHNAGTARRLLRVGSLAANEMVVVENFPVHPGVVLLGTTSNAASVDYLVARSAGNGPLRITVLDANGAVKATNTGVSQTVGGDLTITGDLAAQGGDIDAGASGAAGTVDVFPATATSGRLRLTCSDQAGDTIVNVNAASMAAARTLTLADPLAAADFILGKQAAVARTATVAGATTGTIADAGKLQFITVTSANSAHIVILPTPTPGTIVILDVGANGFNLQTTAPATIGINGGTGSGVKSAIAANSTCVMICVSATSWKGFFLDADSDVAKVAAAA